MPQPDKREEIMQAALELIVEHGFHGAPMALVAERAGVGAGTIYRYFESKEVLIRELYLALETRITTSLMADERPEPTPERFVRLTSGLLRYFIACPLDFRYIEQFHNSPYGVEHRRDKIFNQQGNCNLFKDLITAGVASGEIKDLPLVVLFAFCFGPILAVARDHILGFVELDDALIAAVVSGCWESIAQRS